MAIGGSVSGAKREAQAHTEPVAEVAEAALLLVVTAKAAAEPAAELAAAAAKVAQAESLEGLRLEFLSSIANSLSLTPRSSAQTEEPEGMAVRGELAVRASSVGLAWTAPTPAKPVATEEMAVMADREAPEGRVAAA